ncbi:probable E3 ubiquitin-protein ligase ZFP1 [Salvia miltiorrhiza]|uniref:probable E3 ubiquitin-protein ligase ZFP1 n=1 Tax=Salvia miltiorrhiza TaxID=226208 RepID=UPI0025AD937D|nr:probable E3 ubiquitin-protein ligase ZFP1 [Salvia miltiorrhiza]
MGHRNIQFMRHMIDPETDQGPGQQFPDPCIFYSSVPNFPQPNLQSVVSAPGSQCNFNIHPTAEYHDNSIFYSMQPYTSVQPQYQVASLDVAVAAPSSHYNPYLAPPSRRRDFPVQVNHGALDQFSLSTTHGIVGIPTDSYYRNMPCMDGVRGSFKSKNSEGAPNYQHQSASSSSSSSVTPITARPAEPDITQANTASYMPPEYSGNDPASGVEYRSLASVRNRANMVGLQSGQAHNANRVIQGNYIAPPVQLPGNPWLDSNFGANNGDTAWPHSSNLPYRHASANGVCVEAGVQGYPLRAINRGPAGFMHPLYAQGPLNHPRPTQPLQVVTVNRPSQVATSSHRIPTSSSSNMGINATLDVVDVGPTFLAHVPPSGFRLYRPHGRENVIDPNIRYRNLPNLRVLPEDEVAMLEISGYHEVGATLDQHRDLRLDIDHMSYEELLALGEQIGSVGTGLSKEFIQCNLKVRTFKSLPTRVNLEATNDQQRTNFCAVCQTDYEPGQKIGTLECGHEYHSECIKKWLLMKNSCPVCKSPALRVD